MLFCFLYNVVLENYSVQNSPWGGGGGGGGEGGLLPAQDLYYQTPLAFKNHSEDGQCTAQMGNTKTRLSTSW